MVLSFNYLVNVPFNEEVGLVFQKVAYIEVNLIYKWPFMILGFCRS